MMTASLSEAESLAAELNALNDRRKSAESRLVRQAQEAALDHNFLEEPALIVSGDEWHVGVIGLAAGRLCNQYHCPVCVLSRENGLLHGSLRSVPGIHIHHCLQALDDILLRYGGHEQAAGVTLAADKEAEFRAPSASGGAQVRPRLSGARPALRRGDSAGRMYRCAL